LHAYSTYKKDGKEIDYIRHIRNAVAHARVEFDDKKKGQNPNIRFTDKKGRKERCVIDIPQSKMGKLLSKLQSIFFKYIEEVDKGFRS